MDSTLKLIKESKAYRITKTGAVNEPEFIMQHSGNGLFDSFDNYKKIDMELAENGARQINFLIYCANLTTEILEKNLPDDDLQFRSFLIEENGEVMLKSLELFSPKHCRAYQLVEINKFSRKSIQWTAPTFFTSTIRNFHGCPLYIGVRSAAPNVDVENLPNGTLIVKGFNYEMANSLKSHLNHSIEYIVYHYERDAGDEIDMDLYLSLPIDKLFFFILTASQNRSGLHILSLWFLLANCTRLLKYFSCPSICQLGFSSWLCLFLASRLHML